MSARFVPQSGINLAKTDTLDLCQLISNITRTDTEIKDILQRRGIVIFPFRGKTTIITRS